MTKRIRRLVAALTVTAAVATGTTLTHDQTAFRAPGDTTWGSPATPGDSTWDTPPAHGAGENGGQDGEDDGEGAPASPQGDTTWG